MPHDPTDPLHLKLQLELEEEERKRQTEQPDVSAVAPPQVPLSDPDLAISQLQSTIDRAKNPPPTVNEILGLEPEAPVPVLQAQQLEEGLSLEPGSIRSQPTVDTEALKRREAVVEDVDSELSRAQKIAGGAGGFIGRALDPTGETGFQLKRRQIAAGQKTGAEIVGDIASYFVDLAGVWGSARAIGRAAKAAGMLRTAKAAEVFSGTAGITDDLRPLLTQTIMEDIAVNIPRLAEGDVTPEMAAFDVVMGVAAGGTMRLGAKAVGEVRDKFSQKALDEIQETAKLLRDANEKPDLKAAFEMPDGTVRAFDGDGVGSHGEVLMGLDDVQQRLISEGEATGTVRSGFVDESGQFLDRAQAAEVSGAKVGESSFVQEALGGRGVGGEPIEFLPGTEQFAKGKPQAMPAQEILEQDAGQALRSYTAITDAHKANGGSTIDWRTGRDLSGEDLYSVAVRTGDDMVVEGELLPIHIQRFAQEFSDDLSQPGRTIGTWQDGDRAVLDVIEALPDKAEALRVGAQNGQDAIMDLGARAEISLANEMASGAGRMLNLYARTGGGATIGALIGGATGDTFEDRVRNAAVGAMGGAAIGLGIPLARGTEGFLRLTKADDVPAWFTKEGREFWADPARLDAALAKTNDPEAFSGLMQWRGVKGDDLEKALRQEFPDATPAEVSGMVTKGERFMRARLKQVLTTRVVAEKGLVGEVIAKAEPPKGKKGDYYEVANPFAKQGEEFDSMIHAALADGFSREGSGFYHDVGRVIKEAFGEEDGDMYLRFLAVTSTGADAMSTNITNANKAMMLWKTAGKSGQIAEGSRLFAGVGQRDLSEMLNAATRGERFSKSEKLWRYYKALSGDENAVVIDLWMNRLFGFGDAVSDTQYRFIEQEIFRLANLTGKAPRDVQAALWTGAKNIWKRDVSTLGITDGQAYAPHLVQKMTEMAGDTNSTVVQGAMGEVLNFVRNPTSEQARLFKKAFLEQEVAAQEKYLSNLAKKVKEEKGSVGIRQLASMLTIMGGAAGGAALGEDPLQGAVLGASVAAGSIGLMRSATKIPGISNSFVSGRHFAIDVGEFFKKQTQKAFSTTGRLAETTAATPAQLHASRIRRSGRVKAETEHVANRMRNVDKQASAAGLDPAEVWDQAQRTRRTGGNMHNALPPEWPQGLRTAVRLAYEQQDVLSRELQNQGWLSGELEQIINNNEGTYLRRAYKAFTEPDWATTIKRKHIEVYNQAVNWLEKRLTIPRRSLLEAMDKQELMTLAGRYDLGIPPQADKDMYVLALDAIDRSQAAGDAVVLADRLLNLGEDGIIGSIRNGRMGEKDLRALKKRGDIAPEIRALLGEIEDPKSNLLNSIHATSRLIADHDFQVEIRQLGIDGGWLSHGPDRVRGHDVPLVPEGSRRADVLAGTFTTPEISEAYKAFVDTSPIFGDHKVWNAMQYLSSLPRLFKTVGNYTTHIRNFASNPAFALANADMFIAGPARRSMGETVSTIVGTLRRDAKRKKRWRELGLIGSAARAEEIAQFMRATRSAGGTIPALMEHGVKNAPLLGKVAEGAATAYRWEDEVWKIHAFEARLWNESHWRHGVEPNKLSPDVRSDMEQRLAQEVLDTYPTYSITPGFAKVVRSIPFIGPFVSWHVAVPINAMNTVKRLARNMRDPVPEIRKHALAQAMGILAAGTGVTALRTSVNRRQGLDQDEELAIREFLPEWNRNGEPMFHEWDPVGLTGTFTAGHQFDANDMMKAPVRALLAGVQNEEELDRILIESLREAVDPLISEDLFWGAVVDVARNTDEFGRFIANPGETTEEQWESRVSYLWEKMRPGTLDIMARIQDAQEEGDEEKITAELTSAFGARRNTVDVQKQLGFYTADFVEEIQSSVQDVRRATPDRRNDELRDAVAGQLQSFARFQRKIQAAKQLGLDPITLDRILKDRGMRADIREAMIEGRFRAYLPSTLEGPDPEATRLLMDMFTAELSPPPQ